MKDEFTEEEIKIIEELVKSGELTNERSGLTKAQHKKYVVKMARNYRLFGRFISLGLTGISAMLIALSDMEEIESLLPWIGLFMGFAVFAHAFTFCYARWFENQEYVISNIVCKFHISGNARGPAYEYFTVAEVMPNGELNYRNMRQDYHKSDEQFENRLLIARFVRRENPKYLFVAVDIQDSHVIDRKKYL